MVRIDQISAGERVNKLGDEAAIERIVGDYLGDVFPAAALTVIRGGEVLVNEAWGWIDPDTQQVPVTPATIFDLASVTKLFTVTAFLALVSEGKVGLDDALISVIPEFGESGLRAVDGGQDPHSKAMQPVPNAMRGKTIDPSRVTFRQLLTHTSGLAPWRDVYNAAGEPPVPPDQPEPISREVRWARGLAAICQYPFVGEPGDNVVRYSDLGLLLVGETVARLSGQPLDAVVMERIKTPLNLQTLTYNPVRQGIDRSRIAPTEDDPQWRGRRAWGEVHDENACGVGGVAGHAGLFAAARDVAAFGQAWLEGDSRLGIAPELMRESIQEHAETNGERRGLGWMVRSREGSSAGDVMNVNTYGHTGFTGTSLWIDAERGLVVALLTNRVYPGRHKEGVQAFRRALHDSVTKATDTA
jgi:serine-type D-Ala-D-Ala carboxypeptidase